MPELPPKRIPPPLGGMKPPMKAPGAPGLPGLPGAKPPMMPGQTPALPGARPGMPGQHGMPAANAPSSAVIEERLRKMEEHAREIEDSKKKLEKSLAEMEIKLKDEKEKALSQAIKAREEEALSLKMEQALKEMQDKARVARREQEMEESRARAEEKAKDLERRLNEEREAWVINLKKQMEMRDHETKQVEGQIESRFHDLERRWLEERSALIQSLKSKEDETQDLKQRADRAEIELHRIREESIKSVEQERRNLAFEFESRKDELLRERDSLASALDQRENELMSLRAQLAMVDSQVRMAQESAQKGLNEKERAWQMQIGEMDREFFQLKQTRDRLVTENETLKGELRDVRERADAFQQKMNELRLEAVRKGDECEALSRELFTERQTWSGKIEERILMERNLQETLNARESELGRLKSVSAALESRLKEQFEKERKEVEQANLRLLREKEQSYADLKMISERDKSIIRLDLQEKIAEREREIAALKLDFAHMRADLLKQFDKDKEAAQHQFQREFGVRADLMQKELDEAHRAMMSELEAYDGKIKAEEARHQKEMQSKEAEVVRAAESVRRMEALVSEEREELARDRSAMEQKFSEDAARLRENFQSEKERLERQLSEAASAAGDDGSGLYFERENNDHLSLGQLIWKYLTRTVIVINFRGVPRKFRKVQE